MSLERDYQAELLLELSKLPHVRVWRQNVGTVRTADHRFFRAGPPKGASDIAGIVGPEGWGLFIECKVAGRKRTPQQLGYAKMVAGLGAIYLLADEKTRTVEQVIAHLRAELARRRGETVIDAPLIRRLGRRRAAA